MAREVAHEIYSPIHCRGHYLLYYYLAIIIVNEPNYLPTAPGDLSLESDQIN